MAVRPVLRSIRFESISISKAIFGHVKPRTFSSTACRSINPLMNLAAFSGSKEAQYLSREKRMPRTDFASHIELIRSSEVDPFAPIAGASPTVISALRKAERGESDMQTAYALAISNLAQQLEASKQDLRNANAALATLHDRYIKQERHALLISLFSVLVLSLIAYKTSAFEEISQRLDEVKRDLMAFDWQWLGNTPPHKRQEQPRLLEQIQPEDLRADIQQSTVGIDGAHSMPVLVYDARTADHSLAKPSVLSRMFWAAS